MPNIINKQLFIVDTSIARPISFQIMRGETVQITCRFRDHLDPIVVAGMTATAYWHSREMAPTSWYSSNAVTLESDKAIWNWVPDFGADGAKEYEWYIKVTDSATNISYRAFGAIQMVGSPDSDPGEAPEAHSDYYTKEETDAAIETATQGLVHTDLEINGHALTGDIDLTADDVGAAELIDLAAPFKSIIQYAVGDLATRDGNLYKCVTRYKGPWDASKFEETTVQEALAMKASKVSGAVENDFASFNSTGDIKDSGKKAEDFERSHAYTYITDTDDVTKAFDWSGTVTLQMVENAGYSHDDIKAIVLGDKVTELGTSAFNFQANLISVDFGEGIQTIGADAFFNDYRLPALVFPPSLQSIGQNAFANCNAVSYCLFEQKTEAQVKAMPNYGDWGILAPLTVASQQWVDNRIDNLDASDVGAVPTGRTINNKSLSQNVTLTASDVGALPATNGTVSTDTSFTGRLEKRTGEFFAALDVDAIEYGRDNQTDNYLYFPENDGTIATQDYVAEQITQSTAIYRGSFATKAALSAVQWQTSDPSAPNFVSNNDYAVVQADESQDGGCWRYIYVIDTAQSISRWEPQYEINESPLTQAQLDALNSTATKAKIDSIADKVPNTRTINSKALSADVTLTASDVGAATTQYVDTGLSGKAATADVALAPVAFSGWEYTLPNGFSTPSLSYIQQTEQWVFSYAYDASIGGGEPGGDHITIPGDGTELELSGTATVSSVDYTLSATRAATEYRLGPDAATNPNRDKTLASSDVYDALDGKFNKTGGYVSGQINASGLVSTSNHFLVVNTSSHYRTYSVNATQLTNNGETVELRYPTSGGTIARVEDIPAAYTSGPEMDGTASAGSSTAYAKGDHVHPTDTSRASAASIAVEFDATDTYAVGDYVMKDGQLYKCTTAHSGAWAAADFTTDSMAGIVGNINTILDTINGQSL